MMMMRNANKYLKILKSEGSGKVIPSPYPASEHHQKLTSFSDLWAQS